ncbi:UNVERIFIED_CONTAM: hypothetical protein K2H54_042781 [Gekko kuhli]
MGPSKPNTYIASTEAARCSACIGSAGGQPSASSSGTRAHTSSSTAVAPWPSVCVGASAGQPSTSSSAGWARTSCSAAAASVAGRPTASPVVAVAARRHFVSCRRRPSQGFHGRVSASPPSPQPA